MAENLKQRRLNDINRLIRIVEENNGKFTIIPIIEDNSLKGLTLKVKGELKADIVLSSDDNGISEGELIIW